MNLCSDCIKGVTHDGNPEGRPKTLGKHGIRTYIAIPNDEYRKGQVVLFLVDAFNCIEGDRKQLLADDFARNGWKTVIPDILNGDGIPLNALDPDSPPFDWATWLLRHGSEQTRPPLDRVLAALKGEGVIKIGATGYCFGGRYVFDLALENLIDVAAVSHPSLLKSPEDLEKYAATSKAPLLVNSCTFDVAFPHKAQHNADEILGNGKFAPGYSREYFGGCTHGFVLKGDLSDPKVKAGKEGAFAAAVAWFKKNL
ncbi:alpha/beta-hydrolase [Coprinellus micaceus]|uniref:Alpha/beta-hydrolase n=1 Tax=Coprinellus micaceus TaxID=71717 RepID=A0A4Y7TGE2_COPMI|nr:alpha/beta-hydrolase [Coprinellus micaceus]